MHEANSFITLSYSNEMLPADYGLHVRHLQLFIKKLRKRTGCKIRYYAAGEYAPETFRPHYHAIIFGWSPPDKVPWKKAGSGHMLYRSATVEECWTEENPAGPILRGHCWIGEFSRESASYVARYCMKKIGGSMADEHYLRANPILQTGEIHKVIPEFALMSRRPGIGGDWFDKFELDTFPSDFLIFNGDKVPVPRYFSNKLRGRNVQGSLVETDDFTPIRKKRMERVRSPEFQANSTPERLAVRAELTDEKLGRLKRDYSG